MFGVHDIAQAHRAGLEQLVTLRGGLSSLGTKSPLYKLVVWYVSLSRILDSR
jgi:hypothetical protein